MLHSYILEFLSVAQKTAISCYDMAGLGDSKEADRVAVETMRNALNEINATTNVMIGEGERDCAPMLRVGEVLGKGGPLLDLAVDPLEGTDICASFMDGSLVVLGFGESGSIISAPDVYMEKIYTPYDCDIGFGNTVAENLKKIASAKGVKGPEELIVVILRRERNQQLIAEVRDVGARVQLVTDGDISAIVSMVIGNAGDAYMGSGGAPEGVLSAMAVRNLGGRMVGKFLFKSDEQRERARKVGITDFERSYSHDELVKGNVILILTGVTEGKLLDGVRKDKLEHLTYCESLVILPGSFNKVCSTIRGSHVG
ncbi:fructose-bisphosphatase class II family protein [Neorickettsia sennetsu]|uniref:Fructose-1,6-bisphosphatase n=1 Tax=Ehrlichia sennetsu (strain ATCC VR-367 / Miyayama) TaxID=222891 RepID=Q2GDH4_EHRS3|nr:fructose-bisphosphatase class II family protein [Neorickettsia sennetsu]ABD46057.1 fructose-1,6-bisphosphatase, class II [Neorickettsia sennetsu str. Miyayama]